MTSRPNERSPSRERSDRRHKVGFIEKSQAGLSERINRKTYKVSQRSILRHGAPVVVFSIAIVAYHENSKTIGAK